MDDKRSSRRSFLASFPPQVSFLWSSMCPSLKVLGHHFPPCGMLQSKRIDTTSTVESSQPSSTLTCQSSPSSPSSSSSSSKSSCTNRHVSRSRSISSSNEGSSSSSFRSVISIIVLFLILLPEPGSSCGPGRGGNRRRSPRKLTPLVFMQHVPNVSENTITASGVSNERDSPRITRDHPKFKELVPNYNPDIIFKDEEGTGADRLMTRRLKEKLNTLAISVMNQWPGVKLRVTEGWDQDGHHAANSLHYQGRAVDITTSDRDRSKYGMLARLAVEAGFDWVYYESRYHIHCSVKQERTDDHRAGGCFDATSQVTTPNGPVPMSELNVGDEILALDSDGAPVFTPVLLFLDRDTNASRMYHQITTKSGRQITLTGSHLIFVIDFLTSDFNVTLESRREVFARQVIPGQFVSVIDPEGRITFEKVVDVTIIGKKGVYAPLTSEGNLIVNQVLASCYANINDQSLAHWAFFPLRAFDNLKECFTYVFGGSSNGVISDSNGVISDSSGVISDSSGVISNSINLVDNRLMERKRRKGKSEKLSNGIHWYPKLLQCIADQILPYHYLD